MNVGISLLIKVTHMLWNCELTDITEFENARQLRITLSKYQHSYIVKHKGFWDGISS
jgi:hypothetical protein